MLIYLDRCGFCLKRFIYCLSVLQVLFYALFEHAAGYALLCVQEIEEIGLLLPQVRFIDLLFDMLIRLSPKATYAAASFFVLFNECF